MEITEKCKIVQIIKCSEWAVMQDLLNEMLLSHVDKDQRGSISVSLQTIFIHVSLTLKATL